MTELLNQLAVSIARWYLYEFPPGLLKYNGDTRWSWELYESAMKIVFPESDYFKKI